MASLPRPLGSLSVPRALPAKDLVTREPSPAWQTPLLSPQANRVRCSHHTECFSNCCLMELDTGGNFCAPKARLNNVCLPQTKGAFNLICPCRRGLNCIAKDTMCPRRCHII
ncbi:colipase-like protein 2 isoform X1 [Oryctolagus cuniculus]|uniref:colipase-like protein 2 isoform X1 n=1 Tax=Oryctolagus cuniculus TaxID=9986 RepID=UPI003879ADEE